MPQAPSRLAVVNEPRRIVRNASVLAVVLILFGGALYLFLSGDNAPPPRQVRDLTVVKIMPPPPPPPPPPPMPQQKMIEQPKMVEPELKPPEKPNDQPPKDAKNDDLPKPLSLDAKAEGPGDSFQLGSHLGGSPFGGGGGGTRWGWYSSMVEAEIHKALETNDKTSHATLSGQVRIWADEAGRVTRAQIMSSTGDTALDAAIRDNILVGLVLRQAPPKDMPMPIVIRLTERRQS